VSDYSRREVLGLLGVAIMSGAFGCTADGVEKAARGARDAATPFTRKFFTDGEWSTVRTLVDMVIPRDARSGSATDAGVPEFMDVILTEFPDSGKSMREGLAWLDGECRRRFARPFPDCTEIERKALLDAIAWPKRATPEMKQGADFFKQFRNLTASGFWSSRMGVEDLRYIGNVFNPGWSGCPPAALEQLGVSPGARA
jgi:gluconate 2-dehydrogenase gamma chain